MTRDPVYPKRGPKDPVYTICGAFVILSAIIAIGYALLQVLIGHMTMSLIEGAMGTCYLFVGRYLWSKR